MRDGKMKKNRELSEEDKQAIRKRIDKGERNSSKLAEEFGVGTQQVAGIMAWHLHRDSWT
jgi:transposase-like protein